MDSSDGIECRELGGTPASEGWAAACGSPQRAVWDTGYAACSAFQNRRNGAE
jgi:hypothetical protein